MPRANRHFCQATSAKLDKEPSLRFGCEEKRPTEVMP